MLSIEIYIIRNNFIAGSVASVFSKILPNFIKEFFTKYL